MKKTKKIKIMKLINKPILIMMLIYALIGAFLILDASSISSVLTYGVDTYYFFKRQLIFILIGLFGSLIILRFPTKTYGKISGLLSILFIGLTLAVYMKNKLFSTDVNDVAINLFGFSFQPGEFLKIFLVMYMASYYDSWINNPKRKEWGFLWPLILCGAGVGIILLGGDFGTAALMLALFALVFLSVPVKDKIITYFKSFAVFGLILCVVLLKYLYIVIPETTLEQSYRLNRFVYKDPCDRYEKNSGYQVCNGYIAIDNGGLFGVGIGNSIQKYLYLPASHTDFIFPIVVEELGLIVGVTIIIGYMVLIYLIFRISSQCTRFQNSMICYGVGIYITLHIFINLGGCLGIIPLTGVQLPFLSYGGSFCIVIICALAVVQRIHIENKIAQIQAKEQEN